MESATNLTPAAMDKVLNKMERALVLVDDAQGSIVKLPLAELNLLAQLETARDNALTLLKKNADDRSTLEAIFGGDCTRISRILAVLDTVQLSDMNVRDQRLPTCRSACQSVEEVLADLGLSSALMHAKSEERKRLDAKRHNLAAFETAVCDVGCDVGPAVKPEEQPSKPPAEAADGIADGWGQSDQCVWHVLVASVAENAAMCLERDGEVDDALARYRECALELSKGIAEALPAHTNDLHSLVAHHQEVVARLAYLEGLNGEAPEIPIDQHIHTVQLNMHSTLAAKATLPPSDATQSKDGSFVKGTTKSIALYAALGVAGTALIASGGLLVLGSALGATASVAAGAAGATYCATQPDQVDAAAEKAKGAVDDAIDAATVKAKGAIDDATRLVDLATDKARDVVDDTSTKKFGEEVSAKLLEVQMTVKNFQNMGAETARKLTENVSSTARDAANAGAETAKNFGDAVNARLVDTGSKALSRAEEVNDTIGLQVTEKLAAGVEAVLTTAQEVDARHHVSEKFQVVSGKIQEATEAFTSTLRWFPQVATPARQSNDISAAHQIGSMTAVHS